MPFKFIKSLFISLIKPGYKETLIGTNVLKLKCFNKLFLSYTNTSNNHVTTFIQYLITLPAIGKPPSLQALPGPIKLTNDSINNIIT